MSAAPTPPPADLCRGEALQYRAYLRKLDPNASAGLLIVVANCYYDRQGWSIAFKGRSLYQTPPTGIEPLLDTFYVASWTSSYELGDPPATVEITDGFGTHAVPVKPW